MLAFSACDTSMKYEPTTNSRGVTEQLISTDASTVIKKMTIEGHEYLVFEQGVGWSIAVVHSESCPCHNQE